MDKKPFYVYILIGLWITIGVLFLVWLVIHSTFYLGRIESDIAAFYLVSQFLLFLFIVICSFILVYGIFMKKSWSWLFGIILSSFLGFYIYLGIQLIGNSIIWGTFSRMFSTLYTGFHFIVCILMMFFIPSLLYIMTRPYVRNYFIISRPIKQQTVAQTIEKETVTFDKMITKTIKCPACGETQEIQGVSGETIEVTCKGCNGEGVFHFR